MTTTALLTDHYELTMLRSAIADGTAQRHATFEVFARSLKDGNRFGVFAGLGRVLDGVEDRLWIASAYFVPEPAVAKRLIAAAERGVDVRVLVPGEHIDKRVSQLAARAAMQPLLEAGVRIHEYAPTMLHCKVLVADDVAVCGSANLNMRSLHQDDEVVVVAHGGGVADELAADIEADLERSVRMEPGRFTRRPWWHRAAEAAVGVVRRFL